MGAADCASEASSVEKGNERSLLANERSEKRMAPYSQRVNFIALSTHRVLERSKALRGADGRLQHPLRGDAMQVGRNLHPLLSPKDVKRKERRG